MSKKKTKGPDRDKAGRFLSGNNCGRPKGTVSKAGLAARQLAAANSVELMEKEIQAALDGDKPLLKLFVEKILPKNGLDIGVVANGKTGLEMVYSLLSQLQIDGVTGSDVAGQVELIRVLAKVKEIEDLSVRIKALEEQL